jgi:hypothetical protein
MSKNIRVLVELAKRQLIDVGTMLEVVPQAMPSKNRTSDVKAFRAKVVDPDSAKESIMDGLLYSPTVLTAKLWTEMGVVGEPISHYPSYFSYWRIVGHELSLWDLWKDIERKNSAQDVRDTNTQKAKTQTHRSKRQNKE